MDISSKLWVIEYIIEPGPGFSVAKLLDLEVLVMGGGRERTIEEYKGLLLNAGLELSRTISTKIGPIMMECQIK